MPSLMKRICAASVAALGMSAASAATITNLDGSFDNFGGFDWNSAGSSMTTGTIEQGSIITTVYMANATGVQDTGGSNFNTPNLQTSLLDTGTYEYTVFATITEQVTCLNLDCSSALFTATGGSWTIWYDTSPDANLATGAGITDGSILLTGDINPGPAGAFPVVTCTGGGGRGLFGFEGDVLTTNSTFIVPDLDQSTATSTLQFGTCTTAWTQPGTFAGPGGGTMAIPAGALILQADANQAFQVVPEPGSLALLGAALGLLGFGLRRRVA